MGRFVGYRDGGKTNEEGLYRFLAKLFRGGVPSVDTSPTLFAVSQRAAGANMSVDVAVGDALIPYSTYMFPVFTDAVENVTVAAADPSNPRKDVVVAYVDLSVVDSTISNNPNALKFKAVAGTPGAVPAIPNDAAIQASVGGSNPWIALAEVAITAADTNVTNAEITDRRKPASLKSRLWGGALNTLGHIIPNIADDTIVLESGAQGLRDKTLYDPTINNPSIIGFNGWQDLGDTPDTITPSSSVPGVYDLVFNAIDHTSKLSGFMKMQLTRTIAAPTKSTSLDGVAQYFSKTSPAGMTFTDAFAVSAWIKLTNYGASDVVIASRYNGSSGWVLSIQNTGAVALAGFNGGSGNISYVNSYAGVPLNKWVHITAQLDMSSFTATTTTSYIMIDGIDTACTVARAGSNPTSLLQAGNLEIGSRNGGSLCFPGKIAQVAIYGAKVTQATILASKNQTLTGSESNLISAYSFNNTISDLNTTNSNNLTAQGSAVATNADSPFANGLAAGLLEYLEVLDISFSTNTTITVRVTNGCQIPVTGGISSVKYSNSANPYGLPQFSKQLAFAETRVGYNMTATLPSYAQVPGITCPVYLPAKTWVKIRFWARSVTNNTAGQYAQLSIWDGTVTGVPTNLMLQEAAFQANIGGGQEMGGATIEKKFYNHTAGVKTFNIGASKNAGSGTINANLTGSMFATVELD